LLTKRFVECRMGYLRTMADFAQPRGALLALLAAVGFLVGCSQAPESAAAGAAQEFLQAVESGDGQSACELLSPAARSELEQSSGSPCPQAVLEEGIEGGSTADATVFDTMAQVKFDNQAVFLSHFDAGWLVTAAACTPVPDKPYDCRIKGS
jgi:hypothetical protein